MRNRILGILEIITLCAVPTVLVLCAAFQFGQSALVTMLVTIAALGVFFLGFEFSAPPLRQIMPTVVLSALAAGGRILFMPIPNFQPVTAICIISGAIFGRRSGFMVGALAALVSNFFLGQGPWTPWQMYAWGFVGYLSGILADKGLFEKKPTMYVFGALASFLYGLLLNSWFIIGFVHPITVESIMVALSAGFALDSVHAASTVIFLLALYLPWSKKLERIKIKYDVGIPDRSHDKKTESDMHRKIFP